MKLAVLKTLEYILTCLLLIALWHLISSAVETDPVDNSTLFSLVSPSHSGIKFNNKLKDTKEDNIMIYSNFYGGAGVGIGDVNGDGLQDLYFAGNQVADKLLTAVALPTGEVQDDTTVFVARM